MAKATVYLKRTNNQFRIDKNGLAPVYIQYGHKSKSVLFPTNVKLSPKYWQNDADQPIKRSYEGHTTANQVILHVKSRVNNIARQLTMDQIDPSITEVKKKFFSEIIKKPEKEPSAIELFEHFIELSETRVTRPTINAYEACLSCIEDFCLIKKINPLIPMIDYSFYEGFINYLFKTKKLANNTVGKHIKNLKVFLHYYEQRGHKISHEVKGFKVYREKNKEIFLTQDELVKLKNHDFSDNLRLEKVRDLFVLECSTGLRVSDLKRLTRKHITDDVIYMTAYKTNTKIVLPVIQSAKEVLEKYDYILPIIADSNYNKYLKDVCEEAEINTMVEQIIHKAGKKDIIQYQKWELVTTHIGVKTFITHCAQKGINPKEVKTMTGKSEKVIMEYYTGVDESDLIIKMKNKFNNL